jgi:hypothetical protein
MRLYSSVSIQNTLSQILFEKAEEAKTEKDLSTFLRNEV